jgi:hypothetical protein
MPGASAPKPPFPDPSTLPASGPKAFLPGESRTGFADGPDLPHSAGIFFFVNGTPVALTRLLWGIQQKA